MPPRPSNLAVLERRLLSGFDLDFLLLKGDVVGESEVPNETFDSGTELDVRPARLEAGGGDEDDEAGRGSDEYGTENRVSDSC